MINRFNSGISNSISKFIDWKNFPIYIHISALTEKEDQISDIEEFLGINKINGEISNLYDNKYVPIDLN